MIHTSKQLKDKVRNFSHEDIISMLNKINDNEVMEQMWERFRKKNFFVRDLTWDDVLAGVISKIE